MTPTPTDSNDVDNIDINKEINNLKKIQTTLNQKIGQQNQEISLYKDQIESLNRSIDQYKNVKEEIIKSLKEKQYMLLETGNEITHYLDILEKKFTKISENLERPSRKSSVTDILDEDDNPLSLSQISSMFITISTTIERILSQQPLYDSTQFENLNKENMNLKESLKKIELSKEQLEQEYNSLKITEETSDSTIIELKQLLDDNNKEITEYKNKIEELEEKCKKKSKEINEKKEQISATESRIQSLQKSYNDGMTTIKEINTKLQNRIDEQDELINKMKSETNTLSNTNNDLKEELNNLQQKYDEFEEKYNKESV